MSERLQQSIEDLRRQLQTTDQLSDDDRQSLQQAIDEIHRSLDREEVDSAGLAKHFHESTESFAEAHPQLTRAAGQVADMLAQMGI